MSFGAVSLGRRQYPIDRTEERVGHELVPDIVRMETVVGDAFEHAGPGLPPRIHQLEFVAGCRLFEDPIGQGNPTRAAGNCCDHCGSWETFCQLFDQAAKICDLDSTPEHVIRSDTRSRQIRLLPGGDQIMNDRNVLVERIAESRSGHRQVDHTPGWVSCLQGVPDSSDPPRLGCRCADPEARGISDRDPQWTVGRQCLLVLIGPPVGVRLDLASDAPNASDDEANRAQAASGRVDDERGNRIHLGSLPRSVNTATRAPADLALPR